MHSFRIQLQKNLQTFDELNAWNKLDKSEAAQIHFLRWLSTVLAVCEYMSFVKSWQEKGCSSQAESWQVTNIPINDFDRQVKCDVFVVSMAT